MKTAVELLEDRLTISFGDELKPLRGFFVIAKEMEKQQIADAFYAPANEAEPKNFYEYYKQKYEDENTN